MKFSDVNSKISNIPYISRNNAEFLYDLICAERLESILELGVAHGTATCYMAAALNAQGRGLIKAVDLVNASYNPSAEEQLTELGLDSLVEIVRMESSYTWFLHDEIVRNTVHGVCTPQYDLCLIDGPKNWTIDGAAFFLGDKLLKDGGYLIFDDYSWTYSQANKTRKSTDGITHRSLSKAELETPHIRDIFNYLVMQHPSYSEFQIIDNEWAVARKWAGATKNIRYITRHEATFRTLLSRILHSSGLR